MICLPLCGEEYPLSNDALLNKILYYFYTNVGVKQCLYYKPNRNGDRTIMDSVIIVIVIVKYHLPLNDC